VGPRTGLNVGKRKILLLLRFEPRSSSLSLYQLSYPDSFSNAKLQKFLLSPLHENTLRKLTIVRQKFHSA
jgi:hypothetical protein